MKVVMTVNRPYSLSRKEATPLIAPGEKNNNSNNKRSGGSKGGWHKTKLRLPEGSQALNLTQPASMVPLLYLSSLFVTSY